MINKISLFIIFGILYVACNTIKSEHLETNNILTKRALREIKSFTFPDSKENLNIEILRSVADNALIVRVGVGQYYHVNASKIDSIRLDNYLVRIYNIDSLRPSFRDYIGDNPTTYNVLILEAEPKEYYYFFVNEVLSKKGNMELQNWIIQ